MVWAMTALSETRSGVPRVRRALARSLEPDAGAFRVLDLVFVRQCAGIDRPDEVGIASGHVEMDLACARMKSLARGKKLLARSAREKGGVGFHAAPASAAI